MKVNKVSRPKGLSANVTDNDGRHFIRLNKTKDKTQYPNKVAFFSPSLCQIMANPVLFDLILYLLMEAFSFI